MTYGALLASLPTQGNEFSRYDVIYGEGIDPSTKLYRFKLNPVGGTTYASGPRIVFFTPGGSNAGPTNAIIDGVYCNTYTRTTMAGCQALIARAGVGDWCLFPAGTLAFTESNGLNGESYFGTLQAISGASMRYPTVFGTYDATDANYRTSSANWNKGRCTFDYSQCHWSIGGGNSNSFFYGQTNVGGTNLAFLNLIGYSPNACVNSHFIQLLGYHPNVLFQNCVGDGLWFLGANSLAGTGTRQNVAISAITSSGTTATATVSAAFMTNLVFAGVMTAPVMVQIYGAQSPTAAYNGTYLVSYVDATHFSYTFAGTGGVAAVPNPSPPSLNSGPGPALGVSFRTDFMPPSMCNTNWVFNQCGFANCGSPVGATIQNVDIEGPFYATRFYGCVAYHGGWTGKSQRSAPPAYAPTGTKIVAPSFNQSGYSAILQTANTIGISAGSYIKVTGQGTTSNADGVYPTLYYVVSVNPGVSITVAFDASWGKTVIGGASIMGYMAGNTLTVTSVVTGAGPVNGQIITGSGITQCNITAGSGTSFTFDGAAQNVGSAGTPVSIQANLGYLNATYGSYSGDVGTAPNALCHNFYIDGEALDIRFYDQIDAWGSSNPKLCGPQMYVENWIDIRNPSGMIYNPFSNDLVGAGCYAGGTFISKSHLQVFAADINTVSGLGWGPEIIAGSANAVYSNGLVMNQNNPSGSNLQGMHTLGFTGGYTQYANYTNVNNGLPLMSMTQSMFIKWGPNSVAQEAFSLKQYTYNITTDATVLPYQVTTTTTTGGNNQLFPTTLPTPAANSLLLSIASTTTGIPSFASVTPELSSVTIIPGNELLSEQNVLTYMVYNTNILWARKLQNYFRQYMGR